MFRALALDPRRNSFPHFTLALLFCALAVAFAGSPATASPIPGRERAIDQRDFARGFPAPGFVEGELLVKFRQELAPEDRSRAARSEGDRVERTITTDGLVKVKLGPGRRVLDAMNRWSARGDVEYAAPNAIARAFFMPDDSILTQYDIAWNLRAVRAYEAWDVIRAGDPNIVLAIIDSGVAYEDRLIPEAELAFVSPRARSYRRSPELIGPFVPGYDFVNDDAFPDDDYAHGTNVATIAAGAGNNKAGSAGMAWGVSIMPVKVLDYRGDSNMEWIVAGIRFAADHGAHVANLSLGFPPLGYFRAIGYPPNVINQMFRPLRDAVDYAQAHGTILVAASGNFDAPEVSLPAGYASVIAVGATNVDNRRSSYSSYGSRLDLVAPGGDFTDVNGDHIQDQIALMSIKPYRSDGSLANPDSLDTFFFIGTSAASPHVAGAVALLMSKGITRANEIEQILRSTAVHPMSGESDQYGSGLLDLSAAVRYGRGKNATTGAGNDGGDTGGGTADPVFPEFFSGNPSVGDASIGFQVRQGGTVRVRIFDARGRLIRTLLDGYSTMGARRARWDGNGLDGSKAPSGVYFFRIETPQGSATRKFAFLR